MKITVGEQAPAEIVALLSLSLLGIFSCCSAAFFFVPRGTLLFERDSLDCRA
jgi:hypothetical protein